VPRKTFVAGEILTAADVNTNLMDQAVMSFAGTAARGSAIPSPTEGMVTYLADSDALNVYNGSAWVPAASGATLGSGSILQVVQAEKTDIQSASLNSAAIADVTGLTATITPRATSSKILVHYDLNGEQNNDRIGAILYRDSTPIGVGAAAGSRTQTTSGSGGNNQFIGKMSGVVLDSPNTTSAVAYKIAIQNQDSTTQSYFINRSQGDSDAARFPRSASRIIVMEVAG
jgi:hypothetical protein